ncbi:hypothetical protein GCM10023093_19070 [Nemorincola caseinilytica]|uniref:ATP-dependent dethiobiotin synthetase BioD n=1 Tax=Nemorincola caseinilytica TaxID=2054315 RepID=A0ABP8NHJ1_9BACT
MGRKIENAIAVVGIHTGIGKTIVSAVLTQALDADYWKPIQAGTDDRDMLTVQRLIAKGAARVHPEAILLKMPASPHVAAAAEGIQIDHTTFQRPATDRPLIVETAGGVLSPVSASHTVADLVAYYGLPTILVSQNYLGSINHTLSAIECLRSRGILILGIIISGEKNDMSEGFISNYSKVPVLAHVPVLNTTNNTDVINTANNISSSLHVIRQVLGTANR